MRGLRTGVWCLLVVVGCDGGSKEASADSKKSPPAAAVSEGTGTKGEHLRGFCEGISKSLDDGASDSAALLKGFKTTESWPEGHVDSQLFMKIAPAMADDRVELARTYAKDAGLADVCSDLVSIYEATLASVDVRVLEYKKTAAGNGFEIDLPKDWRQTDKDVEAIHKRFGFAVTKTGRYSRDPPDAWALRVLDAMPDDCNAHLAEAAKSLNIENPRIRNASCEAFAKLGSGAEARIQVWEQHGKVVEWICQQSSGEEGVRTEGECLEFNRDIRWVATKPG